VTSRTGVPTLIYIAQQLCKYVVKFTPAIERLYPANAALLAALEAANSACGVLSTELRKVREVGD